MKLTNFKTKYLILKLVNYKPLYSVDKFIYNFRYVFQKS
jgi:hypothetical protein